MITEKTFKPTSGWFPLFVTLAMPVAGISSIVYAAKHDMSLTPSNLAAMVIVGLLLIAGGIVSLFGFMAVAPNDSRVCLLFGAYKGSVVESGFYWVNPFYSKRKLSRRVRNFETGTMTTPEKKNEEDT